MKITFAPTLVILAAGLALAGCNKSTTDAQADAVRDTTKAEAASIESKADVVENNGEAMGSATEDNARATADAMRNSADAVKDTGEAKADAIEAGEIGATTKTENATTTTVPTKK
jgi:hypothetical protein